MMIVRSFLGLTVAAAVFVSSPLAAQEEERDQAPPQVFKVESYDAASQTLTLVQSKEVLVPSVFKELDKNGNTVEKIAYLTQTVSTLHAFAAKDLRTFSVKGDQLKMEEVLGKLKKGQPVLAVSAGKLVAKSFRPLFRDDVLVLELPPATPMP
jgi:hypothetical protein